MIRNAPKTNYWRCDGTLVACQFAGAGCAFRWSIILTCLIFTFALIFHSHFSLSLFTFTFFFHFLPLTFFITFTFPLSLSNLISDFHFSLLVFHFHLIFSLTLHFYFWFSFSNFFFNRPPPSRNNCSHYVLTKKWHSPLCRPFPANPIAILIKY